MSTKKVFLTSLFTIFIVSSVSADVDPTLQDRVSENPQEKIDVIITASDTLSERNMDVLNQSNADVNHNWDVIDGVAVTLPKQAVENLADRGFVEKIEPDYRTEALLDESVEQAEIKPVWEANSTGDGVDVAVMDSGITENEYLEVEENIDYTGEGPEDLNGHGTHVAGIIASQSSDYRGSAYGADLWNLKVLDSEGTGSGSDIIEGIDYAVQNKADIISISIGAEVETCDGTDAISQAVDSAVDEGVLVVVAAGNSGPEEGSITAPGCAEDALTVGSVNGNDEIASYSSRGPTDDGRVKPDIVAPGSDITSTYPDGFESLSGTSMAAPHVSGTAALMLEESNLTPSEAEDLLAQNATDLGFDENSQGEGLLDAYSSYSFLTGAENETEENQSFEENQTFEDNQSFSDNETFDRNETDNRSMNNSELPPGLQERSFLPPAFTGMTPANPFYGVKRFTERTSLLFTFDQEKKKQKKERYAQRRLEEADKMREKGQNNSAERLEERSRRDMKEPGKSEQEIEQRIQNKSPEIPGQQAENSQDNPSEKSADKRTENTSDSPEAPIDQKNDRGENEEQDNKESQKREQRENNEEVQRPGNSERNETNQTENRAEEKNEDQSNERAGNTSQKDKPESKSSGPNQDQKSSQENDSTSRSDRNSGDETQKDRDKGYGQKARGIVGRFWIFS